MFVSTFKKKIILELSLLSSCGQEEPTYSALWGDNKAFNEVIISPAMLNEHMPHMVMEGLHKVCYLFWSLCMLLWVFAEGMNWFSFPISHFQHWII